MLSRKSLGVFVVCLIAGLAGLSSQVMAQNSQLSQDIVGVDCVSSPNTPGCAPVIESVESNNGRPIIRGFYRSARAASLRVSINGWSYALGTDSELAVSGDSWTLDLSSLDTPIPEGSYVVTVEVVTLEGETITAADQLVVSASGSGSPITPIQPDQPSLLGRLGDTGQPIFWAVSGAGSTLFAGLIIMIYRRNRKDRSRD